MRVRHTIPAFVTSADPNIDYRRMNPIGNRVVSDIAKPLPRLPSEADLRSAAAAKGAGIKRKASGAAASAGRHVEMGQAKRTRGDDGKRIHGGVRVVIGQPSTIADIEGGAGECDLFA